MGLATSSGPARTHAAPTELGGACGRCNYKHGAPKQSFLHRRGRANNVQEIPCKVQQLAGAFDTVSRARKREPSSAPFCCAALIENIRPPRGSSR